MKKLGKNMMQMPHPHQRRLEKIYLRKMGAILKKHKSKWMDIKEVKTSHGIQMASQKKN